MGQSDAEGPWNFGQKPEGNRTVLEVLTQLIGSGEKLIGIKLKIRA